MPDTAFTHGLFLGLSLILALGPQNIFLIRQGALRNHTTLAVMACFVADSFLVIASVSGVHRAIETHPLAQDALVCLGSLFLFYYGISALRRGAKQNPSLDLDSSLQKSALEVIICALGFSLLNPHAIIDSMLIVGANSIQFADKLPFFMFGVISASFLWFSGLAYSTYAFSVVLTKARVWRSLEMTSGSMMLFIAVKLLAELRFFHGLWRF